MKKHGIVILFLVFAFLNASPAIAHELSGFVGIEGRLFTNDVLYNGQEKHNGSLVAQPEYYHELKDGLSFTFTPFARVDSIDSKRTHFDIRELNLLYVSKDWELRAGIGKVFWGVTESQHLVDIINQTDLVESLDFEEKLGQPMIQLSVPRDWGVLDLFVLPYFRERTYPGRKGRLRTPVPIDVGAADYESSLEEYHPDFAVRYSNTIGSWDMGLSYFRGTGREPTIVEGVNSVGEPTLTPLYEIINQLGLDLQLVTDEWLWKAESIYRNGQGDEDFMASTVGFEYTLSGVNLVTGNMEVGLLCEWLYDTRGEQATETFDNDIMLGTRLAFNDVSGTEALVGIIQDLDSAGRVLTLEGSRRIGNHWKARFESFYVLDSSEEDYLHPVRKDNFIQLELQYYF
ncbi:MAG: hypothetical protein ABID09_05035 [Candidatus Omnitrophota bacterium]